MAAIKQSRVDQLTSRIEKLQAQLKKLVRERANLRLRASAASRRKVFNAIRLKQKDVMAAVRKANPTLFKQLTDAALAAAGKKKRR